MFDKFRPIHRKLDALGHEFAAVFVVAAAAGFLIEQVAQRGNTFYLNWFPVFFPLTAAPCATAAKGFPFIPSQLA
ncbi:hypothetical protein [Pontiella sulfatireligans]|uniref:hypothetical protein n=1 Tax=Pontiella sulfatireligans TaxID=2750658 RepID=UPI001443D575|nr:hypothetical protein [Pontiella sulfatireligans]